MQLNAISLEKQKKGVQLDLSFWDPLVQAKVNFIDLQFQQLRSIGVVYYVIWESFDYSHNQAIGSVFKFMA